MKSGSDDGRGVASDDVALMTAIAERADKQAFALLFRRYAPKIKTHLVARGAPAGVADELTQEVMLVVWRKAALFDPARGSLVTWLYTVTRNCLLNQLRHDGDGARRAVGVDIDVPEAESEAAPPSAEAALLEHERRQRLARSLEELPAEQREILHRAYWEGQTMQECADRARIPLGTVKTRVRLALARLRELAIGRSDQ